MDTMIDKGLVLFLYQHGINSRGGLLRFFANPYPVVAQYDVGDGMGCQGFMEIFKKRGIAMGRAWENILNQAEFESSISTVPESVMLCETSVEELTGKDSVSYQQLLGVVTRKGYATALPEDVPRYCDVAVSRESPRDEGVMFLTEPMDSNGEKVVIVLENLERIGRRLSVLFIRTNTKIEGNQRIIFRRYKALAQLSKEVKLMTIVELCATEDVSFSEIDATIRLYREKTVDNVSWDVAMDSLRKATSYEGRGKAIFQLLQILKVPV